MTLHCCQVWHDIFDHIMFNCTLSHSFSSPLAGVPITGCNSLPPCYWELSTLLEYFVLKGINDNPVEGNTIFKDIPRVLHGLPVFPAISHLIPNPFIATSVSMHPQIMYFSHSCFALLSYQWLFVLLFFND